LEEFTRIIVVVLLIIQGIIVKPSSRAVHAPPILANTWAPVMIMATPIAASVLLVTMVGIVRTKPTLHAICTVVIMGALVMLIVGEDSLAPVLRALQVRNARLSTLSPTTARTTQAPAYMVARVFPG